MHSCTYVHTYIHTYIHTYNGHVYFIPFQLLTNITNLTFFSAYSSPEYLDAIQLPDENQELIGNDFKTGDFSFCFIQPMCTLYAKRLAEEGREGRERGEGERGGREGRERAC